MSERNQLHTVYRKADLIVVVDYSMELDAVCVTLARKGVGETGYYLENGSEQWLRTGELRPEGCTFKIPRAFFEVVGEALTGKESDLSALTDEHKTLLKQTLTAEQLRVDRLLDMMIHRATAD